MTKTSRYKYNRIGKSGKKFLLCYRLIPACRVIKFSAFSQLILL